ncbi:glycoside hydrolase family 97 protein [Catalinimonas niigatensis]|uniref:glycoside hydrolase family 97 protein n=1 Tax=Catalinimonas niigatensis TaxID=1397264 RepID=UPI0026665D41|nr:glycoside hydrolase family 97 protein [Catalinimonas niigatensis]WPP50825.1 glycoside hydrolase family 97 protein [Catalinimonas niigatensis]
MNTQLSSPSKNITIHFMLQEDGSPAYAVKHQGTTIIDRSTMGFDFQDQPSLERGFEMTGSDTKTFDERWEMPWGEQRTVRNHYHELIVNLREKQAPERRLDIYFRAYDDGIAFRYHFPEQQGVDSLIIMHERTQFKLTADHLCWWAPGDWDIYEHLYNTSRFTEIDATSKRDHPNLAQTYIPENAVNTPVTMRTDEGLHLSFHEACMIDYADMTLKVDAENLLMSSDLVGSDRLGYKVKRALPFSTPWRTLQISEDAAGLIESKLILNLNEPNQLEDVSWVKPMKYMGIWWEMHLGISTWDYEITQDMNTQTTQHAKGNKHGATTENAKRYIDFAAAHNIKGLLVEGWNTGWNHWLGFEDREGVFDFVTPYPDYDLEEVVRYGKEKGVDIIMHHETSAAPRTYELQMDAAYTLMESLDIHSVKTGYVGKIIPKGEYHHGQWMVNHYNNSMKKAAKHKIALNIHEPIKDTGLRRTYPNMVSREGLRGQEFNAWAFDGGNPPEHLSVIAFTRMLSGPIDYTPGIFNIKLAPYKEGNQINTTLAHQLALYVVIYSPVQMAADLIESYEGRPAFQFIRDVGVDWEQSKVLNGEVGDFVTIARQEKETGNWFVGGISDEHERSLTIRFDFLEKGKTYKSVVYRDGEDAHWNDNPTSIKIEEMRIDYSTEKTFRLAPGGGFAISLIQEA